MNLPAEMLERVDKLIARYPQKRSAVLPLLHLVQETERHVSKESMEWIAQKLNLEPIQVYELVTFYPMFKEHKEGKKQIKVCRTLSCALRGSYRLCEKLQTLLNCPLGEVTENGEYGIEFVECLANCHKAPAVQVNEILYDSVKPEDAEAFLKRLQQERSNP